LEKLAEQIQALSNSLAPVEFTTLIFNFKRAASISDEQLGYFKDVLMSSPMTKHIEINLNWCYEISNLGLYTMLDGLKTMKNLVSVKMSIGGCLEITDSVMRALSDTLGRFSNLNSVSLDFSEYDFRIIPKYLIFEIVSTTSVIYLHWETVCQPLKTFKIFTSNFLGVQKLMTKSSNN